MNISVCGLDCDACKFKLENKCEGCRISAAKCQCVWNGRCDLHDCAVSKSLGDCGKCDNFPCDKLVKALEGENALYALDNLRAYKEL